MTTINIHQFAGYTSSDIYQFVMLQAETDFQITIPKKTLAFKDDNFDVFIEYYQLGYAGQLLSEISTSFAYYVPCPSSKKQFVFELITDNAEKLSDLLYLFVQYFIDLADMDIIEKFDIDSTDFYLDAFDGKLDNVGTWGLLWVASLYLQKGN